MPRNPLRYERRDGLRQREMFGAEGREWRRVEKGSEQNQLVDSSRFLPVAAKKNHNQPGCNNHSTDKIRPNHLAGNCEESHDSRRIR
jgi:hypothetical protein